MTRPRKLKLADDEIIRLYSSGVNTTELGSKYSVQPNAIRYLLKRNGIPMRGRNPVFLEGKEKEIAKYYHDGENISTLSEHYGVAQMTVWQALKRAGVECRDASHRQRRYYVNENYFNEIDTEEKAYYLGYLYADGNNFTKRNVVSMNLQLRDISVLEKLRNLLEYNGPITYQTRKTKIGNISEQCKLTVKNKQLSESLLKWGMKSGKTFDINLPTFLPSNLMPHFLRGFMDGDGWITYSKIMRCVSAYQSHIGFIGFIDLIEELRVYLDEFVGVKTTSRIAHKDGNPSILKLQTNTRKDSIKLGNWLYRDATVFLSRKKEKFDEILKIEQPYEEHPRGETRLSRKQILEIKNLLEEGKTCTEISSILDLDRDFIATIKSGKSWSEVTGYEGYVPKKMLTTTQIQEILKRLSNGESGRYLAQLYSVSRSTVHNIKSGIYRTLESGILPVEARQNFKGANNPNSLLSEELVLSIKEKLQNGCSPKDVATILCIKIGSVYDIRLGRAWSHLTGFTRS